MSAAGPGRTPSTMPPTATTRGGSILPRRRSGAPARRRSPGGRPPGSRWRRRSNSRTVGSRSTPSPIAVCSTRSSTPPPGLLRQCRLRTAPEGSVLRPLLFRARAHRLGWPAPGHPDRDPGDVLPGVFRPLDPGGAFRDEPPGGLGARLAGGVGEDRPRDPSRTGTVPPFCRGIDPGPTSGARIPSDGGVSLIPPRALPSS
jgi:hypothetical protein